MPDLSVFAYLANNIEIKSLANKKELIHEDKEQP